MGRGNQRAEEGRYRLGRARKIRTDTWTPDYGSWITFKISFTLHDRRATRARRDWIADNYASDSTLKESVSATARVCMHPYMDRGERISSTLYTNSGKSTNPRPTLGTGRSVVEVGVTTRMGGHRNSMDMEEMSTATAGSGATAEDRVMGPTARMDITAGTGVHAGSKGIDPTPPNPRMDRESSEVIRSTSMEVGQND